MDRFNRIMEKVNALHAQHDAAVSSGNFTLASNIYREICNQLLTGCDVALSG